MMAMSEARKLRGGRGSREDDEEFFCLSTEVNLKAIINNENN